MDHESSGSVPTFGLRTFQVLRSTLTWLRRKGGGELAHTHTQEGTHGHTHERVHTGAHRATHGATHTGLCTHKRTQEHTHRHSSPFPHPLNIVTNLVFTLLRWCQYCSQPSLIDYISFLVGPVFLELIITLIFMCIVYLLMNLSLDSETAKYFFLNLFGCTRNSVSSNFFSSLTFILEPTPPTSLSELHLPWPLFSLMIDPGSLAQEKIFQHLTAPFKTFNQVFCIQLPPTPSFQRHPFSCSWALWRSAP